MDTEKGYFDRSTVAQYVGTVLFIVLLETHVVSCWIAFLLGPWIICVCLLFVAAPSNFRIRWRRTVLVAGAASALGFLMTQYVFI